MRIYIKPWTLNISDKQIKTTTRDKFVKVKVKEFKYTNIDKATLTEKLGDAWELVNGTPKKGTEA